MGTLFNSYKMTSKPKVVDVLGLNAQGIKQLNSVLSDELKKLGAIPVFNLTLTDDEWNSIPAIKETVAYQGFDSFKIITEFMKKSEANKATADDIPKTITVGEISFKIHEKTHASSDLVFLITLLLTRGNNVAKILLKCDAGVTDMITRKCNQYGISTSSRSGTGPLGPSVITLARLYQSFLPATVTAILGHKIVGNLKSKLFVGVTFFTHCNDSYHISGTFKGIRP